MPSVAAQEPTLDELDQLTQSDAVPSFSLRKADLPSLLPEDPAPASTANVPAPLGNETIAPPSAALPPIATEADSTPRNPLLPTLPPAAVLTPKPDMTPPLPTLTAAPTLPPDGKMSPEELLNMRLLITEGTFTVKKTIESRADLVVLYEQMLGPACMPTITQELAYYGSRGNQKCNALLDKVFAIDREDPLAICARDGIDTRSCRSAYAKLEFDSYTPDSSDIQLVQDQKLRDELQRLHANNLKVMNALDTKLTKLSKLNRKKKIVDETTMAEIRATVAQYLSLACANPRLALSEVAPNTTDGGAIKKNLFIFDDEDLPFAQQKKQNQISNTENTPVTAKVYKHKRLLPSRCMKLIEQSLINISGFPPAICQKWGYYSPTCIDAKRADNRRKIKEAAAAGRPVPEFTPFQEFKTF